MTSGAVRKAVIPAAGFGTRFLPATKAQAKEMLPVVDKPTIQYIVEEAVAAGLTDILIITGLGKRSIEDHFDRQFELEAHLREKDKPKELKEIVDLAEVADIHFVRQGERLGLGHAISVARNHVGDQPFAVMLGDEFMAPETNLMSKMIDIYEDKNSSVLALQEVSKNEIERYGCASPESIDGNLVKVSEVIEKPPADQARSNLAVMGRYVFTAEIFEHLDRISPGVGGELQLTDAIARLLTESDVYGVTFESGRYDTGTVPAYIETIVELALDRGDIAPEFEGFLVDLLRSRGTI